MMCPRATVNRSLSSSAVPPIMIFLSDSLFRTAGLSKMSV